MKKNMYVILITCSLYMNLLSCNNNYSSSLDSTLNQSENSINNENSIIEKDNFIIIDNSQNNNISLIMPEYPDIILKSVIKDFKEEFNKKFEYEFNYLSEKNEDSVNIIIEEISKTNEKINEGYTILADDNDLIISGTSSYLIYKALDYLINLGNYDSNGDFKIVLENDFSYIKNEANYPLKQEIINSGRNLTLYANEVLTTLPSKYGYYYMQGAGSDGTYAYVAMLRTDINPENCIIYKYDLKTWKLIDVSEPLEIAHCNDITYDSIAEQLVISTCTEVDEYHGIAYVDPESLELIEYVVGDIRFRGIAFLPGKNQFIFAQSYKFMITDYSFNIEKSFKCGDPRYITQGLDSDGSYIYDIRWNNEVGVDHQIVTINSLVTKYVTTAKLIGIEGEPENIIVDGNSFIVGCSDIMDNMYRAYLLYENWWE